MATPRNLVVRTVFALVAWIVAAGASAPAFAQEPTGSGASDTTQQESDTSDTSDTPESPRKEERREERREDRRQDRRKQQDQGDTTDEGSPEEKPEEAGQDERRDERRQDRRDSRRDERRAGKTGGEADDASPDSSRPGAGPGRQTRDRLEREGRVPSDPETRVYRKIMLEEAKYRQRTAQIDRLRVLAKQRGDTQRLAALDKLESKVRTLHQRKIEQAKRRMGKRGREIDERLQKGRSRGPGAGGVGRGKPASTGDQSKESPGAGRPGSRPTDVLSSEQRPDRGASGPSSTPSEKKEKAPSGSEPDSKPELGTSDPRGSGGAPAGGRSGGEGKGKGKGKGKGRP